MGRPPEFRDRVRLFVFLERRERAALHARARAADMTLSAFARRLLVEGLARKGR